MRQQDYKDGINLTIFIVIFGAIFTVLALVWWLVLLPARVAQHNLTPEKITFAYERFHDINQNYNARVSQINEYKGYLEGEESDEERVRLRTELAAMKQSCRQLAADYNADAAKINKGTFKDRNLPILLSEAPCN